MLGKLFARFALGVALATGLITCGGSSGTSVPHATANPAAGRVAEQIAAAQANLAAHGLPIRIVAYEPGAPLADEEQVRAIRGEMLAGSAMIPQFDGRNPSSFSVNTIAERMRAFRAGDPGGQDVEANLRSMVLPLIKKGLKILDITWETQEGIQFLSKCLFDGDGLVYDHMMSNICFVEIAPAQDQDGFKSTVRAGAPGSRRGASAAASYAFTSNFLDVTIQWIWGGTRGKINMSHTINWNGSNYINNQFGTVNAWMSLGSAEGQTQPAAMDPHRYANLAWGYGWATPTANFTITYNSATLSFNVSLSGIGSSGKGTGTHQIYI